MPDKTIIAWTLLLTCHQVVITQPFLLYGLLLERCSSWHTDPLGCTGNSFLVKRLVRHEI